MSNRASFVICSYFVEAKWVEEYEEEEGKVRILKM